MDKASVARVCIMFNYKKNIYSLKIFKIMSICCASFISFSFLFFSQFSYLFRVGRWDKKRKPVGLAPLEGIRALWFFLSWDYFALSGFDMSVAGHGPHALNSKCLIGAKDVKLWQCCGLIRAATGSLVDTVQGRPILLHGLMSCTPVRAS